MKVEKQVMEAWKQAIENFSVPSICDAAGVSRRTLNNAIKKGECTPHTFDSVNKSIIKLEKKREETLNQILSKY